MWVNTLLKSFHKKMLKLRGCTITFFLNLMMKISTFYLMPVNLFKTKRVSFFNIIFLLALLPFLLVVLIELKMQKVKKLFK